MNYKRGERLLEKYEEYCEKCGKINYFKNISFSQLEELNEILDDYLIIHENVRVTNEEWTDFIGTEASVMNELYNLVRKLEDKDCDADDEEY